MKRAARAPWRSSSSSTRAWAIASASNTVMKAFSDGLSAAIRSSVSRIVSAMGSDPTDVIGDQHAVGGEQRCELLPQSPVRIITKNHVERASEFVQHASGLAANDRRASIRDPMTEIAAAHALRARDRFPSESTCRRRQARLPVTAPSRSLRSRARAWRSHERLLFIRAIVRCSTCRDVSCERMRQTKIIATIGPASSSEDDHRTAHQGRRGHLPAEFFPRDTGGACGDVPENSSGCSTRDEGRVDSPGSQRAENPYRPVERRAVRSS